MIAASLIIAYENGRLGNSLFQYAALREFAPHASILLVGMDDLRRGFEGVAVSRYSIPLVDDGRGRFRKRQVKLLAGLTNVLTRFRLISVADEDTSRAIPAPRVTRGLFAGIVLIRGGYFQAESVADTTSGLRLRLKPEWRSLATRTLASLPGTPLHQYFVHVRRGDYTTWPTRKDPAVLPLAWYLEQMDRVRARDPKAVFVVTSDDLPYIDEFLSPLPAVHIVHLGPLEDFAIMAGCLGGGILSASTFAWWAAFLARHDSPRAFFLGPRFWAGHSTGQWLPAGIKTSWIEYADVRRPSKRSVARPSD